MIKSLVLFSLTFAAHAEAAEIKSPTWGPKMVVCLKDGEPKTDCPEVETFDSLEDPSQKSPTKGHLGKQIENSIYQLSEKAPVGYIKPFNSKGGAVPQVIYDNDDGRRKVIYGNDDRQEPFEVSAPWKNRARSSVALVSRSNLNDRGDFYSYTTQTFQNFMRVCPTERFAQQYVLPFCTGFLVQPDVVVTAGHCIASQLDCEKTSFVFDFGIYEGGSQAPTQISKSKVYSCKKLLGRALGGNTDPDWAVVQLDRLVCDRDALPLSQRKASSGNPLVLIGHPSGLPTKVADGANVRDLYTHFFDANLDSYGGNSGSPVFNANTGEIFGILVRGEKDFVDQGSCKVSNRCSNTGCFGEDVTYIEKVFNYTPQSRCLPSVNVVNGADYQPQVAPGGIATVFIRNLLGGSAEVFQSQGKPLPTDLKGVSVLVGNVPAGIFFVADSQINIQIPPTLGAGEQTVRILRNGQEMATGVAKVSWNAPALFTFGSRGEGGAALGQALIIKGDSRQSIDLVDGSGAPNAIPVSQDGQSSIVVIYGTGIKSKNVHEYEVYINGVWSELKYSGPVSGSEETSPFVGLDQINVALPAGAANAGSVNLTIRHIPTGNTSKPIKINMGASI